MKTANIFTLVILCLIMNSCDIGESNSQLDVIPEESNAQLNVIPEEANFRINHYTEDCTGVGPQKCLLVQEDSLIGTDEWRFFYSGIEGFSYEPGYIYNLNVKKTDIANPPADASSIKYELIEILSKIKH